MRLDIRDRQDMNLFVWITSIAIWCFSTVVAIRQLQLPYLRMHRLTIGSPSHLQMGEHFSTTRKTESGPDTKYSNRLILAEVIKDTSILPSKG